MLKKGLFCWGLILAVSTIKMFGCSRVENKNAQALYKALGMEDKNKNGVIEKPSFWNRRVKENYKEEVDINEDGKIVEAEAKYYLRNLEDISEEVKQKLPLTEKDKAVLSKLFRKKFKVACKIEYLESQSKAIKDITTEMAKAELFKEALELARRLKNPGHKAWAIRDIATEMAKAGLFKEALEVARTIEKSRYRAETISHIASKMAKASPDRIGKSILKELFKEALEAARTIGYSGSEADAIRNIATEMAKAGLDKSKVSRIFKEALEVARTIEDSEDKAETIHDIAVEMAEAGLFKEALEVAHRIGGSGYGAGLTLDIRKMPPPGLVRQFLKKAVSTGSWYKTKAVKNIATEMTKAGLNKSEIGKIFKEAGVRLP